MSWLLTNSIGDRWNETVRHYAELYEKEALNGSLSKDKLFEIAANLVRSDCSQYIKRAIDILEHLSTTVDSKVTHKSYLIYLTVGYIRFKAFDLAHNCLKQLKIIDANCRQGAELEACLHKQRFSAKSRDSVKKSPSTIKSSDLDKDDDERELLHLLSTTINPNQTY